MKLLERMLPCLLATAAASALWGASETPDREAILVARVRAVMGEMLHRLPDYTCVETIERSARNPSQTKFCLLDRVRGGGAYFKGSELYAWPGAPKLEERDLAEMVGGEGAIGTGDFALHLMAVYRGMAPLHFAGDDTPGGKGARCPHSRIAGSTWASRRSHTEIRSLRRKSRRRRALARSCRPA